MAEDEQYLGELEVSEEEKGKLNPDPKKAETEAEKAAKELAEKEKTKEEPKKVEEAKKDYIRDAFKNSFEEEKKDIIEQENEVLRKKVEENRANMTPEDIAEYERTQRIKAENLLLVEKEVGKEEKAITSALEDISDEEFAVISDSLKNIMGSEVYKTAKKVDVNQAMAMAVSTAKEGNKENLNKITEAKATQANKVKEQIKEISSIEVKTPEGATSQDKMKKAEEIISNPDKYSSEVVEQAEKDVLIDDEDREIIKSMG